MTPSLDKETAEPADPIAPLHAAKTRQLYAADWAGFERWCRRHGTQALPAAPEHVLAYLAALTGPGRPHDLGPGRWIAVPGLRSALPSANPGAVARPKVRSTASSC